MNSATNPKGVSKFSSFKEFYPFYLEQHVNKTCRRMHFVGTSLVIVTIAGVWATGYWPALSLVPIAGYGFAWMGHFFFEHNQPATFKHPIYSIMGDFVMYRDILTGRQPW